MLIGISGKLGAGKDAFSDFYLDEVKYPERWDIKKFADKLKNIVCEILGCSRAQLEDREFKEKPLGEEWRIWFVQDTHFDYKLGNVHLTKKEAQVSKEIGIAEMGWPEDCRVTTEILTPRRMLQIIGTEGGRHLVHPNIWVLSLFSDYKEKTLSWDHNGFPTYTGLPSWIITDVRFPNEAQKIRDLGGYLIRIERALPQRFPKLWEKYHKDGDVSMFWTNLKEGDPKFYEKLNHSSETSLDSWEDWDIKVENNGTLEEFKFKVKAIYEKIQAKKMVPNSS